ncbi:MAG: ABC transporter permease [Micromonosporaceae bacterium]|nr:ABC transporter permease [Micromonosporaceae bacterium]
MQLVILFILLGLGTGALIAGIGLGVVLTYRGSGIINLATGAVAMVAGYMFWALQTGFFGGYGLTTVPAVLVSLVVAMGVGVVMEVAAFRPLRAASPLAKLAASLGFLLTLQAAMVLIFGDAAKQVKPILPADTVTIVGATVPVDRFILAGIVIVITAVLFAVYRWSRFGLATRAASESEGAAVYAGLSPNELSMVNTLLACLVSGLLGILASSLVQLDSATLPLQIVPALAAALFARFTSFVITCTAGLLIGVAESLLDYASTQTWFPTDHGNPMPGIKELLVFLIIVVAMFWRGASLPGRGELTEKRLPFVPQPEKLARTASIAAVVCAVALIVLPFDFRRALTLSLVGAVITMSFVVITGYVGQLSVVQLALSGVAGFVLSHLLTDAGIPFPVSPIIAVAIATVLGLLTAVSALRVRGVSLAVVTLAASLAIEQFVFVNGTWGGGNGGSPVASPYVFGVDLGTDAPFRGLDGAVPSPIFGFVALVIAVALGLYVANLRRTGLGRRMIAVRANERAAAAAGVNVRNVKLIAFGISSFIAGVAGVLYGYELGSVSAVRFGAQMALGLIAFAYVGGITMVYGAVFAGLISTEALFPYALEKWFGLSGNWALLVGGMALIVTLLLNPQGVAGASYEKPLLFSKTGHPSLLAKLISGASGKGAGTGTSGQSVPAQATSAGAPAPEVPLAPAEPGGVR